MSTNEKVKVATGVGPVNLLALRGAKAMHPPRAERASAELVVGEDGLARPRWATRSPALRHYYDTEWGVAVTDDQQMFRLLSLLILQAGMMWGSSLAKADVLDEVFEGFSPAVLARFSADEEAAVLRDSRVIRNARKIRAIIANAKAFNALEGEVSLANLVWAHRPTSTPRPRDSSEIPSESKESAALAKELRGLGFTFVGPRICYSLMQSAGVVDTHLLNAHRRGCSGLWNEDGTPARHLPIEDATPARRLAHDFVAHE